MLLFLYDNLLNPEVRDKLKLPMHFVSFAFIKGKMHTMGKNVIASNPPTKKWGNDRIYGGLFQLEHSDFYIRILDASHSCSLSRLHSNNSLDLTHRLVIPATPFTFNSLEEFSRLAFWEKPPINVYTWLANVQNPIVERRIYIRHDTSNRVVQGLNTHAFRAQYERVKQGGMN